MHLNLVDLVKSFPTNIFLQNLASIQQRTSLIKFDHLAEKSENGSISNLSTKRGTGRWRAGFPCQPRRPPPSRPQLRFPSAWPGSGSSGPPRQRGAADPSPRARWTRPRRTRSSPRTCRPLLGLTQLSNYLTLKGSFSAVSKPNVASKYALESSRRDLQNALLCTVL